MEVCPERYFDTVLQDQFKTNDILVFIHGLNVPFQAATLTAAQLVDDLRFAGTVILFSWPAGNGIFSYGTDDRSARRTAPSFDTVLAKLSDSQKSARKVHFVAHSLGSYVLLKGLKNLAERLSAGSIQNFGEIVFAAPDVDSEEFLYDVVTIQGKRVVRRTTIYSSEND